MKNKIIGILAVILGLIIISFPMIGAIAASVTAGFSIMLMSIWLISIGVAEIDYSKTKSILNIVLGVLALILGLGLIFSPAMFSFLVGITLYLAGIILMVSGLIILIEDRHSNYSFWAGVIAIILGIIYIILSSYAIEPRFLGSLIGIWVILSGILRFMNQD